MRESAESHDAEFVAFVEAASRRLLYVATLLTGDQGQAEDLVQTSLIGAYRRWDAIRADDPFSYVRRSIVNAHASWWRRLLLERRHSPQPQAEVPDPSVVVDQRAELRSWLLTLTDRERAVVVLRYLEDLSEAQTALELGIALGTVKSTAARALSKLRVTATANQEPEVTRGQPRA
ncbi:RNA polymerase sigma-70 factor (sigma-E family) [Motilibacter rhizosphaerae]|uniref:RNA polymerase sigma-70 factor (Sigma-E family) n=1 Tax=Motilibacter rhizosphaerae TaxID=598652 RepID=A0A4Q7N756_9ACTN|nr:RNA polymerase sigma-70 factor (sigma-E family) [Motilibacter rhizosphaerae]